MSEKYVILADVTCDISQGIRDFAGINDYLRGYIHFSDGRDFQTTLDWSNISREEFYKILSGNKIQVTTAPPTPEEVYLTFKSYAQQGYKVLSMSISSKISSTYNVACKAAERVKGECPDCEIYCFDSYKMSGGFGLLTVYAHLLQQEGKSFREVIDWLEENKHRVHQMGPIDDMIFIARRGKITMGKAIMGNFAGVKPMGDCSPEGYVSVLAKVKGINKALDVTTRYVAEMATEPTKQYIIISHSDRQVYAEKLKGMLENAIHPQKVFVTDVFSGCGANIGPGMIAVYFLGEPISEDLINEKNCINRVLEAVK